MNLGEVIWFTGLPCAGKTTIANEVIKLYKNEGFDTEQLDGDLVRNTPISKGIGFSPEDRKMHLLRIGYIAKMLAMHNIVVVCSFVSPAQAVRDEIRETVKPVPFTEVYVSTPLATCEVRDVKGMYAKARNGEIKNFTGVDAPYEPPTNPEVEINTDEINGCILKNQMLSKTSGALLAACEVVDYTMFNNMARRLNANQNSIAISNNDPRLSLKPRELMKLPWAERQAILRKAAECMLC